MFDSMRSTFAASSADENRCERDGNELNSSQSDVIHINLLVIHINLLVLLTQRESGAASFQRRSPARDISISQLRDFRT
jgi:hypothetical protein